LWTFNPDAAHPHVDPDLHEQGRGITISVFDPTADAAMDRRRRPVAADVQGAVRQAGDILAKTGCYVTLSDVKEKWSHKGLTGFVSPVADGVHHPARPTSGRVSIERVRVRSVRHTLRQRRSSSRDRNPGRWCPVHDLHVRSTARNSLRGNARRLARIRAGEFSGCREWVGKACSAWSSRLLAGDPAPTVTGRRWWPRRLVTAHQKNGGLRPDIWVLCSRIRYLAEPTMPVSPSSEAAGSADEASVSSAPRRPDPAAHAGVPVRALGWVAPRVMIAMAFGVIPRVIADDDDRARCDCAAQILELLRRLCDETLRRSVLTHDLGVAAQIADRIAVLYGGVWRRWHANDVLNRPTHRTPSGCSNRSHETSNRSSPRDVAC